MLTALYLTVNERLASTLSQQLMLSQLDKTQQVVAETLPVFSLKQWIKEQDNLDRCVLSEQECQWIWRDIIEQSSDKQKLLHTGTLAYQAHQAFEWQYWYHSQDKAYFDQSVIEHRAFQQWIDIFREHLITQQWCTPGQQAQSVIERAIASDSLTFESVYFLGFDDIPPLVQSLVDYCQSQGKSVHFALSEKTPTQDIQMMSAKDERDEKVRAMAWAQTQIDRQKTVAIIDLNLSENRKEWLKGLIDHWMPEYWVNPGMKPHWPFNISGGVPLSDAPVMKHIVVLTHILQDKTEWEDWAFLAQSVFAHWEEDTGYERHAWAYQTRVKHLSAAYEQLLPYPGCACLAQQCEQLKTWQTDYRFDYALPSVWMTRLQGLLTQLGWPGQRVINSLEYQAIQQWHQLMDEMMRWDRLFQNLSLFRFLSRLNTLLNQTVFQIQTTGDVSLQVLGALEAGGQSFDAVWVCGVTQTAWPSAPSPNPLLSATWQKKHQTPHACPDRERHFSTQWMANLSQSAKKIVYSYPKTQQGIAMEPSPMIAAYPKKTESPLPSMPLFYHQAAQNVSQPIIDNMPLSAEEKTLVSSSVLNDQRLCAFKSFLNHRLGVNTDKQTYLGVSPAVHGILIHDVMARFWQAVKTHHALCRLEASDIETLIGQLIDNSACLSEQAALDVSIERDLVQKLLVKWLEEEKQWAPFEVVATEAPVQYRIGQLIFKLRLDRVDHTADGQVRIVDYKTGLVRAAELNPNDLNSVQMPLYACAWPNVTQLSLVQIKVGQLKAHHKTISDDDKRFWLKALEMLASAYVQGDVEVRPHNTQICNYCQMQSVCRIGEHP